MSINFEISPLKNHIGRVSVDVGFSVTTFALLHLATVQFLGGLLVPLAEFVHEQVILSSSA